MTIVDLTIVNVALPTIGRKLHFSESNLQWVVTAYGLSFGGFLLLGGGAADLLGRRRILMLGLTVFGGASLACALATTDTFLIAMRGVQGLGAAIVLPAAHRRLRMGVLGLRRRRSARRSRHLPPRAPRGACARRCERGAPEAAARLCPVE